MGLKTKWNRFWTLRNTEGGFTLVELVIVIAILAILAGVAVPAYTGYVEKAEEAADQVVLGAVNDAFAAACLEYGMDSVDMQSAGVRVANQQIGSLAYVTPTVASGLTIDAETRAGMVDAFDRYMEGSDRTLKNEEIRSLVWNDLLKCFVFGNTLAMSNGQMVADPAIIAAIRASIYGDMGAESVDELLRDNITLAQSAFSASGWLSNLGLGVGDDAVLDAVNNGSFRDYFTAEQLAIVNAGFAEGATDEQRAAAEEMVAHSAVLYTAEVLGDRNASELNGMITNTVSNSNPRATIGSYVSTGGMGGTLVNTAVQTALYEAFIASDAGSAYSSDLYKRALFSTDNANAQISVDNPFPVGPDTVEIDKYTSGEQEAMAAFDAWLKDTTEGGGQETLAGFMGAMTLVDANVGSIGQENFINQGMDNADVQALLLEVLGTGTATN